MDEGSIGMNPLFLIFGFYLAILESLAGCSEN